MPTSALEVQVAGSHYKDLAIQPVEFIHANGIGFCEGSAIKYLTRWRAKGGLNDLRKARHFIDLLIELEEKSTQRDQAEIEKAAEEMVRNEITARSGGVS